MSKEFFDLEMRNQFLWKKHRSPLSRRAIDVLGDDGPALLIEMKGAFQNSDSLADFDSWARNVLRGCARIEEPHGRRQYVIACVANQGQITELQTWLSKHADIDEIEWDADERSAIAQRELKNYLKQRVQKEGELDALQNGPAGMAALSKRLGPKLAWKLLCDLLKVIDSSTQRGSRQINSMMAHAANPEVRNPERYVRACCENELSKKSGATKKSAMKASRG